jgi:hypothetical protein
MYPVKVIYIYNLATLLQVSDNYSEQTYEKIRNMEV